MLRRTPWHVGSADVDFLEQAATGFVEVAQERVQSSSLEFCTAADVRKYVTFTLEAEGTIRSKYTKNI